MSYIHFKSVYNNNYDKVTFDGSSLTLGQLKKLIVEKSKFSRQVDFDLEITNADTNQGLFSFEIFLLKKKIENYFYIFIFKSIKMITTMYSKIQE